MILFFVAICELTRQKALKFSKLHESFTCKQFQRKLSLSKHSKAFALDSSLFLLTIVRYLRFDLQIIILICNALIAVEAKYHNPQCRRTRKNLQVKENFLHCHFSFAVKVVLMNSI